MNLAPEYPVENLFSEPILGRPEITNKAKTWIKMADSLGEGVFVKGKLTFGPKSQEAASRQWCFEGGVVHIHNSNWTNDTSMEAFQGRLNASLNKAFSAFGERVKHLVIHAEFDPFDSSQSFAMLCTLLRHTQKLESLTLIDFSNVKSMELTEQTIMNRENQLPELPSLFGLGARNCTPRLLHHLITCYKQQIKSLYLHSIDFCRTENSSLASVCSNLTKLALEVAEDCTQDMIEKFLLVNEPKIALVTLCLSVKMNDVTKTAFPVLLGELFRRFSRVKCLKLQFLNMLPASDQGIPMGFRIPEQIGLSEIKIDNRDNVWESIDFVDGASKTLQEINVIKVAGKELKLLNYDLEQPSSKMWRDMPALAKVIVEKLRPVDVK